MLSKLKKLKAQKAEEGFTIIEVMIVLAIAGLIILIVFLAVPALQRNSRNTQRKSDIGRIASAAQTVIDNNNGNVASLGDTNIRDEVGTLGYYTAGNVSTSAAPAAGNPANNTTTETVTVYRGSTCSGGKAIAATASTRSIAVTYSIESGSGGTTPLCTSE